MDEDDRLLFAAETRNQHLLPQGTDEEIGCGCGKSLDACDCQPDDRDGPPDNV